MDEEIDSSSPSEIRRAGSGWKAGPKRVVWSVWGVMSIALLAYVFHFSHNLPYYDDWNLVPLLDGSQKMDTGWLWEQHNAHRIPFPKLILVSLLSVTGWDFRSGMFLEGMALIFIAAMLIRTAARVRGSCAYADLFFPLFLLHWGNFDYLLWNWQLNQMVPVILVLAILSVMVVHGLRPGTRALLLSSVGVVLLPLSGVNGLAYAPGLAIWLLLAGTQAWRTGTASGRVSAIFAQCTGGLSLLLIPIYFSGLYPTKKYAGEMSSLLAHALGNLPGIAKTAAHFVAQGLGPGAVALAPFTSLLVSGLIFVCFAGVLNLAWKERNSRHFAIAELLFLVGLSGLVSAASVSLLYTTKFPTRYALQAAPIFCWIFLASIRTREFFRPGYVQSALALLSVVMIYGNSVQGLEYARVKDLQFSAFEADIQKGNPPSQVIALHQRAIFPYPEKGGASFHDSLGYWMEILHQAGHPAFANIGQEPAFEEVPIEKIASVDRPSLRPDSTNQEWEFAEQRFVYGLRVTGYPLQAERWQITLSWKAGGSSIHHSCFYWNPPPNPQDMKVEKFTCWVYEEVNEIQLEVSPPLEGLRSVKVFLLTPTDQ